VLSGAAWTVPSVPVVLAPSEKPGCFPCEKSQLARPCSRNPEAVAAGPPWSPSVYLCVGSARITPHSEIGMPATSDKPAERPACGQAVRPTTDAGARQREDYVALDCHP